MIPNTARPAYSVVYVTVCIRLNQICETWSLSTSQELKASENLCYLPRNPPALNSHKTSQSSTFIFLCGLKRARHRGDLTKSSSSILIGLYPKMFTDFFNTHSDMTKKVFTCTPLKKKRVHLPCFHRNS